MAKVQQVQATAVDSSKPEIALKINLGSADVINMLVAENEQLLQEKVLETNGQIKDVQAGMTRIREDLEKLGTEEARASIKGLAEIEELLKRLKIEYSLTVEERVSDGQITGSAQVRFSFDIKSKTSPAYQKKAEELDRAAKNFEELHGLRCELNEAINKLPTAARVAQAKLTRASLGSSDEGQKMLGSLDAMTILPASIRKLLA